MRAEFERFLSDLVLTEDLEEIFQVSRQALFRWRQKDLGEYEIRIPNKPHDLIRFQLNPVLRWAAREGIRTPGLERWRKRRAKERDRAA